MKALIKLADQLARRRALLGQVGLAVLRVGLGCLMLFGHGLGKLSSFAERSGSFPDPLGLGSTLSMTLATGAESLCALLLALGLATRLAAVPLIVTMLVAALLVHADDPWARKELAVVYLVGFVGFLIAGGGRFSLDALLWPRVVWSTRERT